MLSAGREITAEERKKRTLGVRSGESRGMTADVSYNSGSWHRAIRASLENVAFQTFGIEFCHLRLSITRSGPLLTKQEGALETQTRMTCTHIVFYFISNIYRALL